MAQNVIAGAWWQNMMGDLADPLTSYIPESAGKLSGAELRSITVKILDEEGA